MGVDGDGEAVWRVDESQILMLAVYAKNERVDLSPDDRRLLRRVVESWK